MSYTGRATRDGNFWMVTVEGVGVTQARHLREVDAMARDLVSVVRGVDPDEVEVEVNVVLSSREAGL